MKGKGKAQQWQPVSLIAPAAFQVSSSSLRIRWTATAENKVQTSGRGRGLTRSGSASQSRQPLVRMHACLHAAGISRRPRRTFCCGAHVSVVGVRNGILVGHKRGALRSWVSCASWGALIGASIGLHHQCPAVPCEALFWYPSTCTRR